MQLTLRKKSKKDKSKRIHPKIYDDLANISQANWEKIVQDGDIRFIIVEKHKRHYDLNAELVRDAMDKMMDQYFREMEIDLMDDELFLLIQRRIMMRDKFMKGDKSAMNFIRLITSQIDDIKKSVIKPNLVKNRIALEKWFGQPLKDKSVLENINTYKLMKEEAEAIIAASNKNTTEDEGYERVGNRR